MMEIRLQPEFKMRIVAQKDKNSPMVDLGEQNITEDVFKELMSKMEE